MFLKNLIFYANNFSVIEDLALLLN